MGGVLHKSMVALASGLLLCGMATAQVDLTARVSRDSALLGDTVSYSVIARGGGGAEVFFVPLPDTLARGGEIYQEPKIDTLANSSEGVAFRLRMVVTSYDSGAVSLPRFGVLVRHAGVLDTLFSEPKSLYFYPTPREADVADIKDIRGPLAQRLTFAEVWPWLLGGLAVLLAIVGWLIYRRYMRRGGIVEAKRRLVPPDELALDALQRLREERAWRSRGVKAFYTEVSDILREFLAAEFGIRTMECTSGKIVTDLRADSRCRREWIKEVDGMLQLADLTKFARFAPTEQDCMQTIDTTEALVRAMHEELHMGDRGELEEEQEGASGVPDGGGAAGESDATAEEKSRRDAERYGPRSVSEREMGK